MVMSSLSVTLNYKAKTGNINYKEHFSGDSKREIRVKERVKVKEAKEKRRYLAIAQLTSASDPIQKESSDPHLSINAEIKTAERKS